MVTSISHKVGAVVVTYHPDSDLAERMRSLSAQVAHVVVVDNGSTDATLAPLAVLADDHPLSLLRNATNLGIAAALNQGVSALRRRGATWALLLDQDSEPASDMVAKLLTTATQPRSHPIAQVAPNVRDRGLPEGTRRWLSLTPRHLFGFTRIRCNNDVIENVIAVTSGSMINLAILDDIGGFDERLFIDFVDTDYCLRAAAGGYATIVNCRALLLHSVGAKQARRLFGLKFIPTFHSPLRRYYLFRNRVHMIRQHARRWPHWLTYETAATIHTLLGILLFENDKAHQFRACALGTWDGLMGRCGQTWRSF